MGGRIRRTDAVPAVRRDPVRVIIMYKNSDVNEKNSILNRALEYFSKGRLWIIGTLFITPLRTPRQSYFVGLSTCAPHRVVCLPSAGSGRPEPTS